MSGPSAHDTCWSTPSWQDSWRVNETAKWDDSRRLEGQDMSDPPNWSGLEHHRDWKRAVRRWNQTTDVWVGRRNRVIQIKYEHVSDVTLQLERHYRNVALHGHLV